jgi:hypothetical protein
VIIFISPDREILATFNRKKYKAHENFFGVLRVIRGEVFPNTLFGGNVAAPREKPMVMTWNQNFYLARTADLRSRRMEGDIVPIPENQLGSASPPASPAGPEPPHRWKRDSPEF